MEIKLIKTKERAVRQQVSKVIQQASKVIPKIFKRDTNNKDNKSCQGSRRQAKEMRERYEQTSI